jgi:hypothetical protein
MTITTEDVRAAKADAKGAKARAKALRPWYKKKRWLGLIAIVVIAGIAVASGGGDSEPSSTNANGVQSLSTNGDNPPAADVTVSKCEADEFMMTANLAITNNSSKRSDYFIEVAFLDANGTHIGDGLASASNVEPGQSAAEDAGDFAPDGFSGAITCKLTDVNRTASV